jgi:hypothetical protein
MRESCSECESLCAFSLFRNDTTAPERVKTYGGQTKSRSGGIDSTLCRKLQTLVGKRPSADRLVFSARLRKTERLKS